MEENENYQFDVESLSPETLERYRQRFNAEWDQKYSEYWYKKGLRIGRIECCLRVIRLCLAKRFPNFSLSPQCDEKLQSIDDPAKLEAIEDYCEDAPSVAHVEGFIEAKFREQNDTKEENQQM